VNIESSLRAMFEHLGNVLSTKTVFGEPIRAGETTLIPVLTITFGLGTGGGAGKDEEGDEGSGGAAGVGAKLVPRAIVAVTEGKVEVFTMSEKSGMTGLIERVPEMLNLVVSKFGGKSRAGKPAADATELEAEPETE